MILTNVVYLLCLINVFVRFQAGCSDEKVLYYENKEGGHGGAADSKQQAYMTVTHLYS